MKYFFLSLFVLFSSAFFCAGQNRITPSSDIYHNLERLSVNGSVLYIAAHPDDENTRLLSYLVHERKLRTGYLSLTRGDGGQNLIGDEQGIELGLIRTQELLAARKVDGAEQFFTSAFDFGYSKSPDETLEKWNHQKILGEVVYIIRKFRPDVIITRFPVTGEGGHGHHTASAILAGEAFEAAADPSRFAGDGLPAWKATRLFWNSFNFGNTDTRRDNQLKIDVGGYNPVLGISYGEMAAKSRSNHRSQGFGVPAQRGTAFEYFSLTKGTPVSSDLLEGIDVSTGRFSFPSPAIKDKYDQLIQQLISTYDVADPARSIPALQELHRLTCSLGTLHPLHSNLKEIEETILAASGIFLEALSSSPLISTGDSARYSFVLNNRSGIRIGAASVSVKDSTVVFDSFRTNENNTIRISDLISMDHEKSQPYWLQAEPDKGSFNIPKGLTGLPETHKEFIFNLTINGETYHYPKPLLYKYTDPVKGEIYQDAVFTGPYDASVSPALILFSNDTKEGKNISITVDANKDIDGGDLEYIFPGKKGKVAATMQPIKKGNIGSVVYKLMPGEMPANSVTEVTFQLNSAGLTGGKNGLKKISYDHIPAIYYHYKPVVKVVKTDLKTVGKTAGYIAGAGDKIPEALQQMGYTVTMLNKENLTYDNIKQLDVIITGIRAYNIHSWLSNAYDDLMRYVKEGGVLLVQYNTNNSIGPVKTTISPYPFTISRSRITDENAAVNFLLPDHPVLNYPNKITQKDFEGWVQERSIYQAENIDQQFQKIISMRDPGEEEQSGSLIVAPYGKGRFIYTGLVFFRELPAGVAGAFRLFANLIANKK